VPHFAYRARDGGGKMVEGVVEANDSGTVASQLFGSGITPLEIVPTRSPVKSGDSAWSRLSRQRIGSIEVLMFSRQMYTLLKSGVPIMGALKGLQESSDNPSFADVVRDLRESLDSGRELSVSLGRHPKVFNAFYVAMVRVGEQTGNLENVFLRLFEHLEFEKFMREQVKSAIRYPAFVVFAMVSAVVVINIWVIPAFAKVYEGFKVPLPIMTRFLIAFSNFMVAWWPVLLGLTVGAVFAVRAYIGSDKGRLAWDRLKLRLPVAGKIVLKATLSRFARSFALALGSGVPAVNALTMVSQTVENEYVARRVDQMRMSVERGESVLRTAAVSGIFTPVVLQMIAVGEESGALDDLLAEVADMYQRDVEYDLKSLASQIEPILVIGLGIVVLVLALGVFLPIWDLGATAFKK
jgi:MSHA biogenesis protein MshG